MQSEIQRQIDEHRSTDRVVVLDFPLLGENPRKGLAATIVVDIPVDVAVERLVDQRGMDEDDARARINSQISRDERLATATHVLDNGGDRDSLTAQVDELWQQLARAAAPRRLSCRPPRTGLPDCASGEHREGHVDDGDVGGGRRCVELAVVAAQLAERARPRGPSTTVGSRPGRDRGPVSYRSTALGAWDVGHHPLG